MSKKPDQTSTETGRYSFYLKSWIPNITDKLFQLKNSAVRLLLHLGYEVPEYERRFLWEDFSSQYARLREVFRQSINSFMTSRKLSARQAISGYYRHGKERERIISVQFMQPPTGKSQVSVDDVNTVIENAIGIRGVSSPRVTDLYIITSAALSSKAVENIDKMGIKVKIFTDDEIIAQPYRHVLNQKYWKLTDIEREEFFKTEGLGPGLLPQFTHDDPIVKSYGWKIGDVIRIVRNNIYSNSLGKLSVTYRVIVPNPLKRSGR